ncbi:uncharacterized protein LOC131604449 [Vicia villosa]|uniref:uncharacterized protein LOC131604449 n=1 Tax=Vicia villosa TaxID=3911 RepID=UPI00273B781D|nr:uncharacterized protein LOC131604449 [Vicia villosa]
MAIMVNGSCTDDFKAERGLGQGDPLSPLLFIIKMEGLICLMEKAVALGEYRGFQFEENNSVDILNFADDTIIFGEDDRNMQIASSFLACGVGVCPFKFSGVMVGDSPRKIGMWKEVARNARKRLDKWRGRDPRKVIKELIGIQRKFLWRGVEGERCISWWKWRILTENNLVWYDLVRFRWIGEQALSEVFPELYARASLPFMSVAEAGHSENSVWYWDVQDWFSGEDEDDLHLVQLLTYLILHFDLV